MLLILIGFMLILWAIVHTRPYRVAKKWKQVDGVVLSSSIERHLEPAVYANLLFLHPHVKYKYEVDGAQYVGEKVSLEKRNELIPGDNTDSYWDKWGPGENVVVYFNPLAPSESVLIPYLQSWRKSHYIALIVAGVLLMVVGFLVVF